MIELLEFPPTRSQRAKWALEELEIPYSAQLVDMQKGGQNSSEHRELHPLGAVPVLRTPAYSMFESVAIVMQLLDEHPDAGLAPAPGSAARAHYYQWCVYACADLDPTIMAVFDNTLRPAEAMRPPKRTRDSEVAKRGREDFDVRAAVISDALRDRDHLLGNGFSGADIAVGHSCFMAAHTGLLDNHPVLVSYYEKSCRRPAHRSAYRGYC